MIEYRKAVSSDIQAVTQMRMSMLCEGKDYSQSFQASLRKNTQEYITNGLCDNSISVWIAVQDQLIVAMGSISFFLLPPNDWCPGGKTAYLGNVYTLTEYRKRGIASELLVHIVDEAKSCGCERIMLNTTDMGKSLYHKCGFEPSPTAMALYPFGIGSDG